MTTRYRAVSATHAANIAAKTDRLASIFRTVVGMLNRDRMSRGEPPVSRDELVGILADEKWWQMVAEIDGTRPAKTTRPAIVALVLGEERAA